MRELRHALRSLLRTPVFAITAVVILTLSVGATTAVFTLLHALVLRPLAVPNPHELVQVSVFNHLDSIGDLTWRQYRELSARLSVFSTIITSLQQGVMTVETGDATHMAALSGVSGNYFSELGAAPAIGRLIEPSDINEATVTGEPVAVISWEYWQRQFGGDHAALGRTLKIDGVPVTIVGVAPKGFMGQSVTVDPDVTVPLTILPGILRSQASMVDGTSSWVAATGRLRPGTSLAQARTQIETLWPDVLRDAAPLQYRTTQREDYFKRRVSVDSGANGWERGLRRRYTEPLYVLLAIAGIVLVIAGVNLCSLVFARIEARRHELGVRLALGSGRWRVIREITAEGAILGAAGGAIGLLFAAAGSRQLTSILLQDYIVRTSLDVSPDATIVAVAGVAGISVASLVTGISAWLVTRPGTITLAPGGARTVARSWQVGRLLVGTQVALSIVLLSQASLLVRSVYGMSAIDSGLTTDTVVVAYPTPRVNGYRNLDPASYYPRALERVRAVPGVAAAAFSTFKPEGGALPAEPVGLAGTTAADGDATAEWPLVSPGFFETIGIPILRGRDFTFGDHQQSRKVAIISAALERRLFGEGRGLGARIRVSRQPDWQDAEVVGIARDARVFDVRRANTAIVYTAAIQSGELANWKSLVVRGPERTAIAVQKAIDDLGVEYIRKTQTLDYARGRTILQERVMAGLGGFFGILALVLVSVGVYGLLSYVLSLRRKEFGIRLALGANPASIAGQVAATAAGVTAIGLLAGLAVTVLTAPLLRSVLVNTSPYDPMAIGGASLILLIGGAMAAAAPARRAARVEPVAQLRRD